MRRTTPSIVTRSNKNEGPGKQLKPRLLLKTSVGTDDVKTKLLYQFR